MARKWFNPEDDPDLAGEAEQVAIGAVMRATYAFNGWGHLDRLALSYVDKALLSYRGGLYETEKGKRTKKRKPRSRMNYHGTELDEDGKLKPDVFDYEPGNGFHSAYRRETSLEDRELVQKILAALPAPDGEILRRHHMDGEETASIAESLGCSQRTIQRSLEKSRKFLLEKFADHVA
jgi:RNA polymerase sigma factor (sigma-70 family)